MLVRALACMLSLACAHAGAAQTTADSSEPYDRFRAAIDGLETPLLPAPDLPPANCASAGPARTHGLFIGAGAALAQLGVSLPGPANDVALFRNTLVLRGANEENLTALVGAEATHTNLTAAAQALLVRTGCGDSVILHFSGWALNSRGISLPDGDEGPFSRTRKTVFLAELGGFTMRPSAADTALAAAPFALLNAARPDRGEVLSAAALSEFVTLLRNRGGDVSVILDTPSATDFAVESRQARIDSKLYPRLTLSATAAPGPTAWQPTLLAPSHGALTVFYGTERGNPGLERRLPPEVPDARVFGMLSYQLATAITLSERTTIGALARHIDSQSDTIARDQSYTFVTTDADLDLVAEARAERAFQAPQILIDSPELTRAAIKLTKPEVEVRGRVNAKGRPILVQVNGNPAQLTAPNAFLSRLKLKAGVNRVSVHAITDANESLRYDFELSFAGDIRAVIGEGQRYALIIANQDYPDVSGIADLKTPVGDASALRDVLTTRYGFKTVVQDARGNTVDLFLENADSTRIAIALGTLEKLAGPRDSVLIFYAGHGEYDEVTDAAYWLPVNAVHGYAATFMDAKTLDDALHRMQAGNVLVISDSCYSGMLLRSDDAGPEPASAEGERLQQLQRMAQSRSRVVLSSGGNTPVLDGGGDGHSVFARALLRALKEPEETAFSARDLHRRVFPEVVARSDQEPDFRTIYGAGHDAGDFVFLVDP